MSNILFNGANIGTRVQHTTGASAPALSVATASWTNANVAIGYRIYNQTDGSSTLVTSVTTVTVVGTLAGGAENDWDVNDYGNVPGVNRYELNTDGVEYFSIHYKLTSGTANDTIYFKLYGTNNPNATADDDTNWVDLSTDILGAASLSANNTTIEDIIFIDTPSILLKYMVKVVSECATGAFANSYYINVKTSE